MSVNKVNKTTGELVTLANGTRMWIGTQSAHDAAVRAGTMPNNCMVCITDDFPTNEGDISDTLTVTSPAACKAWKEGKLVNVRVIMNNTPSKSWDIVGTVIVTGLPKPAIGTLYMGCVSSSSGNPCRVLQLNTDGSLETETVFPTEGYDQCTFCYIAED